MSHTLTDELYKELCKAVPIPCVDIVVFKDEKLLLLKRAIEPLKGYWCLPGGRITKGETPEEAAHRKVMEETGIIVYAFVAVGTFNYFHKERHDIALTYLVRTASDKVVLNFQHDECKWVTGDTIPDPIHDVTLDQLVEAMEKCWKEAN